MKESCSCLSETQTNTCQKQVTLSIAMNSNAYEKQKIFMKNFKKYRNGLSYSISQKSKETRVNPLPTRHSDHGLQPGTYSSGQWVHSKRCRDLCLWSANERASGSWFVDGLIVTLSPSNWNLEICQSCIPMGNKTACGSAFHDPRMLVNFSRVTMLYTCITFRILDHGIYM